MDTVGNAMGKRSSPVDDYIRELLAASPQGKIDESFSTLQDDPTVRQGGPLHAALFDKYRQESDIPNYTGEESEFPMVGMPVYGTVPGGRSYLDQQNVIREAMKQPPLGTEEMNPRPDNMQSLEQPTMDMYEEQDENTPQDAIDYRFPKDKELLKTPGWIPANEPGVAEQNVARYEDLRTGTGSRTAGGSAPGHTLPFRLRGPAHPQLDEQTLIQQLLSRFR